VFASVCVGGGGGGRGGMCETCVCVSHEYYTLDPLFLFAPPLKPTHSNTYTQRTLIRKHNHTHIHIHSNTHIHQLHTHTHTHMRTHAHTHTHASTHTRTHTHIHAHTRTHTYKRTHTHTYTHIHAHTHTDTHQHPECLRYQWQRSSLNVHVVIHAQHMYIEIYTRKLVCTPYARLWKPTHAHL